MEVSTDSTNFSYDPGFDFLPSHFSFDSPSTSQSDLLGFHCNNSSASSSNPNLQYRYPNYSNVDVGPYPSPPPSTSNPKRSVPLPFLSISGESLTGVKHATYGGILDSPVIENHVLSRNDTPISPPTTVPTSTFPLPSTDGDFAVDGDEPLGFTSPQDDQQALLSPLSPEWVSSAIDDLHSTSRSNGIVLLSSPRRVRRDSFGDLHLRHEDEDIWPSHLPSRKADQDARMTSPRYSPSLLEDTNEPISFLPRFPHPSSPSIPRLDLDLDSIQIPDSPAWSPASLPELDMDDDDSDSESLLTPPSPSSKPLSLPGAECQDELLDGHFSWSNSDSDIFGIPPDTSKPLDSSPGQGGSLLLIDDPDVLTPRSPSPDNFDLDPSLYSSCPDPDVERLLALRRKSQAAERNAKEVEERSLSSGSMFARAEARKTRKKEKERVKEISAMLRLKLEVNDGTGDSSSAEAGNGFRCRCPSPEVKTVKAKKAISSIPQLVARMMLRRRDGSDRPITHMPTPPMPPTSSPLRKSWLVGEFDDSDDEEDSDDTMGLDDSIMDLKGFDDFSISPTDTSSEPWSMMIDGEDFGKK
ncbi:hypothetical protein AAF712_002224 [Marasmius tenuissimus]|uniref:Uncharacterized protein n=1 Tax=Marasmius tenuissimus TaxID=585030 RepID=A0ABR3A9K8_9AGAR